MIRRVNSMKEYTDKEIQAMRERLFESEWEGLSDKDLKQVLWEGCVGMDNVDDHEIVEHYEEIYGEED
jgi:hypothetical protein